LEVVYQRAFERIEIMDRSGYDCVWLAEHHFNTYSVCPSVTLMGTHIAARTKHVRIGTAVTLAGFYHPLRLAEELAMLDIFSSGRLNWGAGRGFDATEFRAFEVDVDDSRARLYECVEIVLSAWQGKRFSHAGKFWRIDDVEVLPQPVQRPSPPVWMAASSPEAVRSAAKLGYSILQDPHSTHAQIGAKRALYEKTLAENGFTTADRDLPIARLLAIGTTREAAIATAREGAQWTIDSYNTRREPGKDPIETYMNDTIIYGTPDEVADKLIELRETIGLDYLIASPLSHETFMLLTEQVLPRLA
jgi:alkanesulfonate monooxygenase SsuD/methylene tetrahydromethanopterin reductase-like flavin-dependent oxidoreductase (luciferase family)